MHDEGKYRRWTATGSEHGRSLKRTILRTYCALEWVMRTGMGVVTCVDPMVLTPAPPILRTTWGALIFATSQKMESALFHEFIYSVKKQQSTFSLPLICPHDCQYLPKSLRAFMCSCDHTAFRACKLLFELGGSESYLLENTIPVMQRLAVPKGWV